LIEDDCRVRNPTYIMIKHVGRISYATNINENDFKRHMDYIHYNPVKHGITLKPEEYRYSSFNKWVKEGFYEKGWGHTEPEDLKDMKFE